MRVLHTAEQLAAMPASLFVPTMGALHDGHASLIRAALAHRAAHNLSSAAAPIIVSIFVNPTQFNDPKDLARYPRTLEADCAACQAAGADAVFAPEPAVIYPPDRAIPTPALPSVATRPGLEDRLRPGHFAGVCQVVARLFDLVRPTAAFFGEKDWQQLQVIRAMTAALALPIRIVPVETRREPDALAMSSRNIFLSPDERVRARAVPRALTAARGYLTPAAAERVMHDILLAAGFSVEYAVIRDALTLESPTPSRAARALIAARLPSVRLIDNAPWGPD